MNQLLLRYDSFDSDHFEGDAENRANAGLSVLQRWEAAEGSAVWILLSVNDPEKANGWLSQDKALGHGPSEAHFLRTA